MKYYLNCIWENLYNIDQIFKKVLIVCCNMGIKIYSNSISASILIIIQIEKFKSKNTNVLIF